MSLIHHGSLTVKENRMILVKKKDKIINVAADVAYQMFINGKEQETGINFHKREKTLLE